MEQKTVFISYRRETSKYLALLIYDKLKQHGWDVFLDVDSIDSGDFDRIILRQIAARAHFIFLIAPGSLQRCADPGDWLRRELEEALRLERNIVPVYEEDSHFKSELVHLPNELRRQIAAKQGQRLPHDFFEAAIDQLQMRRLKTPEYIAIQPVPAADLPEVQRRLKLADAPPAPPPAPEPSPYTDELVVDARGGAKYTTINAALKAAPAGARITVRPGLYQEGIVLRKRVTIEGQGGADQVIVENDQGNVLVMVTDEAVVSGLGLRCTAGSRGKSAYGVKIPQGRLILRDCAITSDSLACVGIHNAGTRPSLFNCIIYGGDSWGVYVYDEGAGVLEDCQISGNGRSGLVIATGGNPIVRRCTLKENKLVGVFINEQGAGVLDDCQIIANATSGVTIIEGSNPIMRHCTMKGNKQSGVFVKEQGAGVLEDCQIIANAKAGLATTTGGNPTVRRCTITQNEYQAVWAYQGGRGTVEDCDLRGNKRGAWDISADSTVTRRNNQE